MTILLRRRTLSSALALGALLALNLAFAPRTHADTVNLNPVQDGTLYENADGLFASGSGPTFFVGRTNIGFEDIRRGLMQFDIAGSLPAGATIDNVRLTLYMSRTVSGDADITLHTVQQAWGEGASDAGTNGGSGVNAAAGDATWKHTFYNGSFWTNAGGDFDAASSGSATVGNVTTFYTWGSTAAMVADVQGWLDAAATNHGWLLLGDESTSGTAKRFDSRESSTVTADRRPVLTIDYTPRVVPVQAGTWTAIKGLYR